jgi:DNA repair exonuclease SbcCD nuclease subunit
MDALIFADIHIHPFRAFAEYSEGDNSRRLNGLFHLNYIVETANDMKAQKKCDVVILAGDISHDRKKIDPVSLHKMNAILATLEVPMLACSGTHDLAEKGFSNIALLQPKMGIKIDKSVVLRDKELVDWTIMCVPDPWPDTYAQHQFLVERRLQELGEEARTHPIILVTHGFIVGDFRHPHWVQAGLDYDFLNANFFMSIVGHVHDSVLKESVLIPGHACPQGFGDEGAGYFWELHAYENGTEPAFNLTRHEFQWPKFVTVSDTFSNFDEYNYYRIQTGNRAFRLPSGIKGEVIYMGIRREDTERPHGFISSSVNSPTEIVESYVSGLETFSDAEKEKLKRMGIILSHGEGAIITPEDEERLFE